MSIKTVKMRFSRWLLPLTLLWAACSIKYVGPGPVGMNVTVRGAGTGGEIKIVRDVDYLPHVLAGREEDLYFGAGFAMAQDRFFQLDMLRRAATGTLSELLGKTPAIKGIDLATMDALLRTFRFRESALVGLAQMDERSRSLLQAFTDGINRYLVQMGDGEMFEYSRDKQRPDWWKPEDSLAIMGLFGLTMTVDSIFDEYYMDRLLAQIGPEAIKDWVSVYPLDFPVITAGNIREKDELFEKLFGDLSVLFREYIPHPIGSNNWAVSGKRTKSGKALLANDPHVPMLSIPTFWYHLHIKGGGIDMAGMMFPGFPGFGAGTNGTIAWALTNTMADYIDLFRERVNPSDPNLYLYKRNWEAFRRVTGVIRIKGARPRRYSYRMTRHGVVLESGMVGNYKIRDWAPYEVIAYKFVDLHMGSFMAGYFDMTRAKNWEEFRAACKKAAMGPVGWNHTYADIHGNIGYQTTANIPIREDNQGVFMRKGWTGEQEWDGYAPFEQLPSVYNPKRGYILTANNRVAPDDYPYYISGTYIPYRARRIDEFLAAHPDTTVEDIMALQADVVDLRARKLVPFIIEDLKNLNKKGKYSDAIAALNKWREEGYDSRVELTGPTVFNLFTHFQPKYVFADELGKKLGRVMTEKYAFPAENLIDRIMDDPGNKWFDDVRTPAKERRDYSTGLAMDEALNWIRSHLGRNPDKWRWGRANFLKLYHPAALYFWRRGRKKLVRGPYPYPGSGNTVNNASAQFRNRKGFQVIAGPSSRLIVDFSHPQWFYTAASTGMASNPDDPHFTNLTDKWLKVEYHQMRMDDSFMEGNNGTVLIRP